MLAARKQRIILWWSVAMLAVTGFAFFVLLGEFPPPSPTWSADQLAHWYQQHHTRILVGAVLSGWTSAFFIQFAVVVWAQMVRVERGAKIWSALALVSCSLTAVFVALPAIAFGAAAYGSERAPEITQVMHHFAVLAYVTTDQLYIGGWVAIAVISFTTEDSPSNPFPRWWGWATVWTIVLFEPGSLSFLAKTGPFAVNGVVSFFVPVVLTAVWTITLVVLLLRALRVQESEESAAEAGTSPDPHGMGAPTPANSTGGAARASAVSTRN